MTKIIILTDETLDRFYARTLAALHAKYHPPALVNGCNPTQAERDNQAYYDSMGRAATDRLSNSPGKGK